MKKFRNIMIILAVLIIILIITILVISVNKNNTEEQNLIESLKEIEDVTEITNETTNVSSASKFSTVQQCVQQYYDVINNKSTGFYNDNNTKIVSDEYINQLRLDLLSEEYIEENNITINNINKYIETIDEKVTVNALQMKELINIPTEKYLVYGIIINLNNELVDDFYIYVNLDTENSTFSVEPIINKPNDIEKITLENSNKSIQVNDNNEYNEIISSYEDRAKEYFSIYKKMILAAPQILYNYLDTEYRESRFGSLEEFENYIKNNQQEILETQLQKYLVNNYTQYTEYVCMDQYQKLYIFDETNPMEFTLKLDTYTVPTEKFTTTYKSSNEQDKVMMNIDKWVQMLNNRDYTSAYNVLDETYRNNTFGNEVRFESIMKEILPLHYEIEYNKFSEEGKTYLLDITLKDITGENEETTSISVFMQLNEDLDFVMSFSIE